MKSFLKLLIPNSWLFPNLNYFLNDIIDEVELPSILGLHSPKPCSNQQDNIVLEDIDPSSHNEIILYAIIDVVEIHHALGLSCIPPYINLEEDDVLEDTDYFSKQFSQPTFPSEEANDTHAQEIIVETLHLEMMVVG